MIDFTTICFKDLKFLISASPSIYNIKEYINLLKLNKILHVIRVCEEKTYPKYIIEKNGFIFYEYKIKDGNSTTIEEEEIWINLFSILKEKGIKNYAIHCKSGLGRAPLFLALILLKEGIKPYEVINFIRNNRRGALNSNQVKYILEKKKIYKCYCTIQ